jgi:2,3-bisphosphoglycerate-dependent phosphoglycerate mutase
VRPIASVNVTASEIILIRHAEAVPSEPGSSDTADNDRPLSAAGRIAAESVAAELAHLPITAVFSSPYRRAIETVAPIAASHRLQVQVDEDLRERRLAQTPLVGEAFLDAIRRARADVNFSLPGGESTEQVMERANAVLGRMTAAVSDGIAVAGTHGGFISIVRWSWDEEFSVEDALNEPTPALYRLRL